MKRLLLDTNVVVAGLLWNGAPRRLLDRAIEDSSVELYSSPVLIDELTHTLGYPKFAQRIVRYQTSIFALVTQYQTLVTLVSPTDTPRIVPADVDDDHVVAAALAANASLIVTGDGDLLCLSSHSGIPIVSPAEALSIVLPG